MKKSQVKIEKTFELGGRKLTLSTGLIAQQASGAVMATYGETVVLATVVSSKMQIDLGYFPLTVDYQERLYAGGRIKGSRWVKREGRPSDEDILTARLIDRSIRPLFPKDYKKEVQVIVTLLSVDSENDPSILASIATSAALAISEIPWGGPVGSVKVGMKDGKFFTNPLDSELPFSDLDLVVSSTKDAVIMIEAGAKQVPEDKILEGIEYGQKEANTVIKAINELVKEVGKDKEKFEPVKKNAELVTKIKKLVTGEKLEKLVADKAIHEGGVSEFEETVKALSGELTEETPQAVASTLDEMMKQKTREIILSGKRPDGRKHNEIRKLFSEVSVLPRTHGSALFQRGQTQVLSITTLGSPSMEQLIESAEGEESKRYIHHYSMPPYATGETGRFGSPSRREIGHGALAERALEPVIPAADVFPYTIRVVSEVTSSNGSSSMASTCGSTLSLMDAGVPITSPVSGIAMGLIVKDEKEFAILSDIIGLEDFNGDMDFKVTGTEKGVTALQLDVKTLSLNAKMLKAALEQAKEGRALILKSMMETLSEARTKVSTFAPKIKVLKIPQEKIGELIGPGGRNIKKIIAETGAQVEVDDDGSVNISGIEDAGVEDAIKRVEALTKEVQAGEIYEGEVKRIQPFGAFVEILPGKEGLVHVSDMSQEYVKDPADIVNMGDKVQVRVKEIDDLGRINLSMLLDGDKEKPARQEDRGFRPRSGSRDERGGGRRFSRGGGNFNRRPSGPHFPTSRYLDDSKKKDYNR